MKRTILCLFALTCTVGACDEPQADTELEFRVTCLGQTPESLFWPGVAPPPGLEEFVEAHFCLYIEELAANSETPNCWEFDHWETCYNDAKYGCQANHESNTYLCIPWGDPSEW